MIRPEIITFWDAPAWAMSVPKMYSLQVRRRTAFWDMVTDRLIEAEVTQKSDFAGISGLLPDWR
jgi:hypothetical protein